MVERGICLEEHQQESHQEMCMLRLVFRCSHCNGDYMNKEGLWNHLDLHEITDENKEINYQEVHTRLKIHQCEVCNDQRAYSESCFWKHVQEVHGRVNSVPAHFKPLEKTHSKTLNETNDDLPGLNVDPEMSKSSRDITDLMMETKGSKQEQKQKCPHCLKLYTTDTLPSHLALCESEKFSGDAKGKIREYLTKRMRFKQCSKPSFIENHPIVKRTQHSNEHSAADTTADSNTSKEDIQVMNFKKLIQNPLQCPHCGTEFNHLLSSVSHINQCHKAFKCEICDITIYGETAAKFHKVTKHGEPSFECEKCSKNFLFKGLYVSHIAVCNGVDRASEHTKRLEQSETHDEQQMEIAVEETKFIPCQSNFTNSPDVSEHEEHRQAGPSTQKSISLQKPNKDNSPKVVMANPVSGTSLNKCISCKQMFPDYTSLAVHFLHIHVPTSCEFCGINFTNLNRLLHHKQTIHTESVVYTCEKCSKKCFTRSNYDRHVRLCENMTDQCENCGQWFKDIIALATHVALGCANDNFASSYAVSKYEKNMTPAKCSACGKEFHSVKSLSVHVTQAHRETKCDICGVIIVGKSKLRWHECKNPSKKIFKCAHCSKIFTNTRGLNPHEPICAGRKFSCDFCGQKFKFQEGVRRHKKRVHSEEIAKQTAVEEIQREDSALTLEKSAALQTILKHPDNSDDSQVDSNFTALDDENKTIKMEIQVEDTMLQE